MRTSCAHVRQTVIRLMIAIHQQGGQLVPVGNWDRAKVIADAISDDAQRLGHPLVCRAVAVAAEKQVLR